MLQSRNLKFWLVSPRSCDSLILTERGESKNVQCYCPNRLSHLSKILKYDRYWGVLMWFTVQYGNMVYQSGRVSLLQHLIQMKGLLSGFRRAWGPIYLNKVGYSRATSETCRAGGLCSKEMHLWARGKSTKLYFHPCSPLLFLAPHIGTAHWHDYLLLVVFRHHNGG